MRSLGEQESIDKVELALHVAGKDAFPDTSTTVIVFPNGLRGRGTVGPNR
jgi:hypothetical protein